MAGEARHQRLAGEKALFLAILVPVTAFISSPQLLAWPGSLTHWEDEGENKLSYPRGVTAASLDWSILFAGSVIYVCVLEHDRKQEK